MFNRIRKARIAKALAVGGLAVGMVAAYAPATYASTARPAVAAQVLNEVGSDTVYWAMAGSDPAPHPPQTTPPKPAIGTSDVYDAQKKIGGVTFNPNDDNVVETTPFLNKPFPGPTYTVPADANCGAITYSSSNLPPGGSSAGISALVADATSAHPGCIDFARSSRGFKTGDDPNLEFVAYGIDALDWVTFHGNAHKVKNLTPAQIQSIYTCNPATHLPFIQFWDQIPGGKVHTQIVKYAPQILSGTYSFFVSKYLGGNAVDAGCAGGPDLTTFTQEHDATGATNPAFCPQVPGIHPGNTAVAISCVNNATTADAIDVFSTGQWNAQKSGVLPDLRNNTILEKVNDVKPSPKTINETPSRFFGSRYVYNVLYNHAKTNAGGSEPSYAATLSFAGVSATTVGFMCTGDAAKYLKKFGIIALPIASSGPGLPNSACRKDPVNPL